MNHDHLPALKRYTSPQQYAAMQKIDCNKSMVQLLMNGAWSKTLGALLRSAWIAPHTYTDDAGVLREGWTVTDAGRHAMQLYELKAEEEAQEKARLDKVKEKLYTMSKEYYRAIKIRAAYAVKLTEWADKAQAVNVDSIQYVREIHSYDARRILEKACADVQAEGPVELESYEEWKERRMGDIYDDMNEGESK